MLNKDEQGAALLREKPQLQMKRRLTPFLMLAGGIVILGALLVVAWQVYTANQPSSSSRQTCNTCTKGRQVFSSSPPWERYPAIYWQTLRTQVAQGFHMSEQQMKSALQPAGQQPTGTPAAKVITSQTALPVQGSGKIAGQSLSNLARTRGISPDQLHAIEVAAVQQAHTVLVNQRFLTQQQASENIQAILTLDQDSLNAHIIEAFAGH